MRTFDTNWAGITLRAKRVADSAAKRSNIVSLKAKGMTLVEVVVAMCVLVLVLGGILSSVITAASQVNRSEMIYRETAILNDKVEEMRAMPFTNLLTSLADSTSNSGEVQSATGASVAAKLLSGNNAYSWERTSVPKAPFPVNTTFVTVTVKICPKGQASRSLSVTTQISKRGLIVKPAT